MQKSYLYNPESVWKQINTNNSRNEMVQFANKYINFISECKTERETINWIEQRLTENGFSTNLNADKMMRQLHGKALFAVKKGIRKTADGFLLIAAHGDTPRLDFKQHPIIEQANLVQAKTHYYGGIRKYQWLARPLALHGVVILSQGQKLHITIGEKPDEPVFCISDLLPHLAKKQQEQKLSEVFEGEKLNIILGHEPLIQDNEEKCKDKVKANLLSILHNRYGIVEEDFITAELQAVPAGASRYIGFDKSMIGGYGQDDRICVFCSVEAFLNSNQTNQSQALIIWDKEEIGSDGVTGASSRFLEYCFADVCKTWDNSTLSEAMLNTNALSADVTAALDPDFQDAHDKNNVAHLGDGPCFSKYTGSGGKYSASEANAEYFAQLRNLFNKNNIPWQAAMLGKVDGGGGGTVALFLAAYGMNVIDLGPALLSMHSPFEISSTADLYATYQTYKCFFESHLNEE